MKILLSNDDGYYAVGIQELIKQLEKDHEIYVAAPSKNHSAGSSALTVRRDIKVNNVKKNHYVIDGTPADCVHIALTCLIKDTIDLVVSGINLGANLGDDVIYSGTVAAALEGRHLRMSPIAISLVSHDNITVTNAAILSSKIIYEIMHNSKISENTLLNVNIPDHDTKNIAYEFTRLGTRGLPLPASETKAKDHYRIGAAGPAVDSSEDTDFFSIKDNKISITPLTYDLTNKDLLNKIKLK